MHRVNIYRERRGLPPLPTGQRNPAPSGSQEKSAQPTRPGCKKPSGPGTELKALLASLGLSAKWCIGCQGKAAQMDRWGVDKCREERETIRGWMIAGMKSATWWETGTAAALAVSQGLAVNPLDPAGWMVDEAIRRAEASQKREMCFES